MPLKKSLCSLGRADYWARLVHGRERVVGLIVRRDGAPPTERPLQNVVKSHCLIGELEKLLRQVRSISG